MPRLPDASNLNSVNVSPAQSFTQIATPDISGAYGNLGQGLRNAGVAADQFMKDQQQRAQAQERFDTRMRLLQGEEAYNERVKDLDPLDPDYVEKIKTSRKEVFAPILSGVQDTENKQYFNESTYEDFIRHTQNAEVQQRDAFGKKAVLDVDTFVDAQNRKVSDGADALATYHETMQAIDDNQYLDGVQRLAAKNKARETLAGTAVTTKAVTLRNSGGTAAEKTAAILRQSEGFQSEPYFDVNKHRAGYGSDTVTLEDGRVIPVQKGVAVSKADAERDLARRTNETLAQAAKDAGPAWNNLTPDQQAALGSVAYNYGSLPKRVVAAVQSGDAEAIANSVESLSDHNGGINRKRREREAAIIRGEAVPNARPSTRDTLDAVKNDPMFKMLPVEKQTTILAGLETEFKKADDEEEKAAKLNLSRGTVDYAVSAFANREEAVAFVKKTISDPDTREDTLLLLDKEYNRIDENAKADYKAIYDQTFDAVSQAVDEGRTDVALAALNKSGIGGEDRAKIYKLIADGKAVVDDPETYNSIQALKLGSPEERDNFVNLDLRQYQGRLKPGTIDALAKEQEALKKQVVDRGKAPGLDTAATMLDQRLREIGVSTDTNASATDLRYTREIRSIMSQNLDAEVKRLNRDLTPTEVQKVMDDTFMQYRGKQTHYLPIVGNAGVSWGLEPGNVGIKDVLDKFTAEDERQGLPQGSLVAQATADLNAQLAEARADLEARMRISNSRVRSEKALLQYGAADDYVALAEEKAALDNFRIDAETLAIWLERSKSNKVQP